MSVSVDCWRMPGSFAHPGSQLGLCSENWQGLLDEHFGRVETQNCWNAEFDLKIVSVLPWLLDPGVLMQMKGSEADWKLQKNLRSGLVQEGLNLQLDRGFHWRPGQNLY
ncbi:hypothetical protein N7492_006633 [Penicillium capsulatum]|uniref:Uncharacterized protein n=1 Tax=Penicillium capsulatum TaxID=69766 RepID=A0A9W9I0U2_9EURO|nr:hypothetical protein N7492_006633 [Penicillium capsulatum]